MYAEENEERKQQCFVAHHISMVVFFILFFFCFFVFASIAEWTRSCKLIDFERAIIFVVVIGLDFPFIFGFLFYLRSLSLSFPSAACYYPQQCSHLKLINTEWRLLDYCCDYVVSMLSVEPVMFCCWIGANISAYSQSWSTFHSFYAPQLQ